MESNDNYFPAKSVLNSYIAIESMLAEILRTVPYCIEHENIWSPVLVTVLLEACSQLDSVWEFQARQSRYVVKKRLSMRDYHEHFREQIAFKWVVFWGEKPEQIYPYDSWNNSSDYSKLDWWDAYNKVKHNRLLNRTQATFRHAVWALSGLFLAILGCEFCREAISEANWLSGKGHNLKAHLSEGSPSDKQFWVAAESQLFSYPVGWAKETIPLDCYWQGSASHRFRNWFDEYSTEK